MRSGAIRLPSAVQRHGERPPPRWSGFITALMRTIVIFLSFYKEIYRENSPVFFREILVLRI